MLRSLEDLFGLRHLGYADMPGLRPLGRDVFTCYRASSPPARGGWLPRGSEIKLAVIAQGTAPRPMVEVKLWHAGRLSVKAERSSGQQDVARHAPLRPVGHLLRRAACQLVRVALPSRHGLAVVSVSAFGGVERRTLSY